MATSGWGHVTAGDLAGTARPAKYRNVKVEIDGVLFDSQAEGRHWLALRARERAGEITALRRQVAFPLFTTTVVEPTVRLLVASYIADFVYLDADGHRHVVDVKRRATRTRVYQLKRKWLALQSGVEIEEIA